MFKCKSCEKTFDAPKLRYITHGLDTPPYEAVSLCPLCGSSEIERQSKSYCYFCGLEAPEGQRYCSGYCKKQGEPYRIRAERRDKEIKSFRISKGLAEVEEYNRAHNTRLSYGQYFALKGLGKLDVD